MPWLVRIVTCYDVTKEYYLLEACNASISSIFLIYIFLKNHAVDLWCIGQVPFSTATCTKIAVRWCRPLSCASPCPPPLGDTLLALSTSTPHFHACCYFVSIAMLHGIVYCLF